MSAFSSLFKRKDGAPVEVTGPPESDTVVRVHPHLRAVPDTEELLPLQAEIARVTNLDPKVMAKAADMARTSGSAISDVLLMMKVIQNADVIEAQHLAKITTPIDKLHRMPRWDTMLHVAKSKDVIAVCDSVDPKKRCFVIFVEQKGGVSDSRIMLAMNTARQQGWKMAGRIQVPEDFLRVIESDYKARLEKKRAQHGDTSDVPVSVFQEDFTKLAQMAFDMRASDIHITLRGGRGEVKFRIDGELEMYQDWTEDYTEKFCAAVYNTMMEDGSTKAGFSKLEKQDGAIEKMLTQGLVRFRYAHIPISPNGLDVTLRIIPVGVENKQKNLADLGYSSDQQQDLDRIFAHSSGLIFFLGTTGSGKSTSMAVALEAVARAKPGKKIRTVEQPVEYQIKGAYQTSVSRDGFVPMLEQLMRMDPDYMMIGETRDMETAAAVLQGARSGHLCVSTLHADGAPLAYDRLLGLGVARHELASVGLVVGLIYQKLVPVLCPTCKITAHEHATRHPHDPILNRVRVVNEGTLDGVYMGNPVGCPDCGGRGFKGRTVCAEILRPTVSMLSAIASGNSRGLWTAWRATIDPSVPESMRGKTAFEHAILKMRQGIVSPVAVESEFRFLDEPPFEDIGEH